MTRPLIAITALITMMLWGCRGSETAPAQGYCITDTAAYDLGQEYASQLVDLGDDEDLICEALLDSRARQQQIRAKRGAAAAADYEQGFLEYLRIHAAELAAELE